MDILEFGPGSTAGSLELSDRVKSSTFSTARSSRMEMKAGCDELLALKANVTEVDVKSMDSAVNEWTANI